MTRARLFSGAQNRFQAHDRRWRIIAERQKGSVPRMRDWALAYLRWENVAERRQRYEPPTLTLVGNLVDQLQKVGPSR